MSKILTPVPHFTESYTIYASVGPKLQMQRSDDVNWIMVVSLPENFKFHSYLSEVFLTLNFPSVIPT